VLVDDLHRFDELTRDVLVRAAGRLDGHPVAMVATAVASPQGGDIERLPQVVLGPLDETPARELLLRGASPSLPEAVVRRLLAIAAGNPAALTGLPSALTTEQESGGRAIDEPLLLGGRLLEVFARGLDELPPSTARCLLVAATSDDPAFASIARACELLGEDAGELAHVEAAGIVAVVDGTVRFRHRLVRSAVVSRAPPAERRTAHRALAAAQAGVVPHEARHLAAASIDRDEAVAGMLADAARWAFGAGDGADAAALSDQAADLTPAPHDRVLRRLDAAALTATAGERARTSWQLRAALHDADGPVLRARVHHLRARLALLGQMPFPDAVSLLASEAAVLAPVEPDLSLALQVDAEVLGVLAGTTDRRAAMGRLQRLHGQARSSADGRVRARIDLALAAARACTGDATGAHAPFEALPAGNAPSTPFETFEAALDEAVVRGLTEDTHGCREVLGTLIEGGRRTRTDGILPLPLALLANAAFLDGEWLIADRAAGEAAALARLVDQPPAETHAALAQLLLAAGRGREEECRQAAPAVAAIADVLGIGSVAAAVRWAMGLLELGVGRLEAAATQLQAAGALLRSGPAPVSPGVIRWRADLVEALVGMGLRAEAERETDQLGGEATRYGSTYAAAAAARCRGLLVEEDGIDRAFTVALALQQQTPNTYERARLELCWGRRLTDAGLPADAHAHLTAALAAFEELDATSWAATTRGVLARSGVAPHLTPGLLTSLLTTEQMRIARGCVRGRSPRQIADELLLPASTVRREQATLMALLQAASVEDLRTRLADGGVVEHRQVPRPVPAEVQVLGGFQVHVDGAPVAGLRGMPGRLVQAVACLGGRADADQVVELLWPDQPDGRGRARLRNLLWRVQELAGPILVRDGAAIRFPTTVEVDALRFTAAADAALVATRRGDPDAVALAAEALARSTGPLLEGQRDEPWMDAPREALRRRVLALLHVLAADAAQRGDADAEVELLERAIELAPHDEERYLRSVGTLRRLGRTGAARDLLRRAEAAMTDLGLPLSAQLRTAIDELHDGSPPAGDRRRAEPATS
jgi:DNA-binding SARP family transcriptional activator